MSEVLINGVRYIPAPPDLTADAPELDRVLVCPISYEHGSRTIRDYFYDLLKTLWDKEEGFSGKRPFGNSGWTLDLLYALAKERIITATFDSDGDIYEIPQEEKQRGYVLIESAIAYVFYGQAE